MHLSSIYAPMPMKPSYQTLFCENNPWVISQIVLIWTQTIKSRFYKMASIRWQDSAPPISGYWPTSGPNAGQWHNDVTAAAIWGEVCATQVLPMRVGPFAFRYQGNGATPASILIPLERQLIALQFFYNFAADSFYIMLIFALDKLNIRHISTSRLVDLLT